MPILVLPFIDALHIHKVQLVFFCLVLYQCIPRIISPWQPSLSWIPIKSRKERDSRSEIWRFRHELNEWFPTKTQLGYEAMVGEMKINTRIKRSCSIRFRFSFLPPRGKPIFFFHFPFPRSFPQPVCLLNPFLEEWMSCWLASYVDAPCVLYHFEICFPFMNHFS